MLWRYATSLSSERSGIAGASTRYPSFCRRSITWLQLDASAQAPWTSTTVGFAAPEAEVEAASVVAVSTKRALKMIRAARVVSSNDRWAVRLATWVNIGVLLRWVRPY